MRYARERDTRNRAAHPPGEGVNERAGWSGPVPLPQSLERWIAGLVGPSRVQGVVSMALVLLGLLVLRIGLMGRCVSYPARAPTLPLHECGVVDFGRPIASALGSLPGDVHLRGPNYQVHFPVVSCVVFSMLASVCRARPCSSSSRQELAAAAAQAERTAGSHANAPGRTVWRGSAGSIAPRSLRRLAAPRVRSSGVHSVESCDANSVT
jgi:hypothetical protein